MSNGNGNGNGETHFCGTPSWTEYYDTHVSCDNPEPTCLPSYTELQCGEPTTITGKKITFLQAVAGLLRNIATVVEKHK